MEFEFGSKTFTKNMTVKEKAKLIQIRNAAEKPNKKKIELQHGYLREVEISLVNKLPRTNDIETSAILFKD